MRNRQPGAWRIVASLLVSCAVGGAAAAARAGLPMVEEVCRVLEENGLALETNAVGRSAVEGMLKALDPGGGLLARAAAEALGRGATEVETEELLPGILYARLAGLYADGPRRFAKSVEDWPAVGRTGLVLDLRDAGGQCLAAVDELAAMFLDPSTTLYSLRDSRGRVLARRETVAQEVSLRNVPLVVLVNRGTRGASEALAAALRKQAGVIVVGGATRGDPGVREIIPLSGGHTQVLYLATSWILPHDGMDYAGTGVAPDVLVTDAVVRAAAVVPPDHGPNGRPLSEAARRAVALTRRVADDPVLVRAMDILLGLRALGESTVDGE